MCQSSQSDIDAVYALIKSINDYYLPYIDTVNNQALRYYILQHAWSLCHYIDMTYPALLDSHPDMASLLTRCRDALTQYYRKETLIV